MGVGGERDRKGESAAPDVTVVAAGYGSSSARSGPESAGLKETEWTATTRPQSAESALSSSLCLSRTYTGGPMSARETERSYSESVHGRAVGWPSVSLSFPFCSEVDQVGRD